jgi:hypothetical protein
MSLWRWSPLAYKVLLDVSGSCIGNAREEEPMGVWPAKGSATPTLSASSALTLDGGKRFPAEVSRCSNVAVTWRLKCPSLPARAANVSGVLQ